jgi:hypothetical protein
MNKTLMAAALLGAVAFPLHANAQEGAATGAAAGVVTGAVVGGPVGAAVGGVSGAVIGGIADDQRPRFREHVIREHRPSFAYREQLRVGTVLPESGVTYYDAPVEFGVKNYRYTVVNERPVLVEPQTRRVVQIID